MRYERELPVKARIRKRKMLKKKRFFTLVVLTIVIAYCISYALSRTVENSYITVSSRQNAVVEENSKVKQACPIQTDIPNEGSILVNKNDSKISTPFITPTPPQATATKEIQNNKNSAVSYEALKKDLQSYIGGLGGKYGIYYLNLIDGGEFGINQTDEFVAASTVKIPINLYLFKKIKEGSVDPLGTMKYLQVDYEEGTGSLQYQPVGKRYTVRELSEHSIEESDNVATNMLIRLLGLQNIKQFMRQTGGSAVDDSKNITCPRDMGLYMKAVYDFSNEDSVLGKELLGYFLNTKFNDRIPELLPENIAVAHKIGTQVRTINDVGIVYTQKPYILSVFSVDVDEDEAADAVAQISKKVYDFVK